MTDEQIIKALECCVSEKDTCQNCPFQELKHYDYENEMFEIMPNGKQYDDWSCERWLNVAVLDLITRQQAEIERLQKIEIETDDFCRRLCRMRMLDGSLIASFEDLQNYIKKEKSEAVKEFAERLCDGRVSNDPVVIAVKCGLKEMVGDKE